VPTVGSSIQRLIDDMVEIMQQANGVGLAAPQVGVPLRVVVLQMPGEEPFAIINGCSTPFSTKILENECELPVFRPFSPF